VTATGLNLLSFGGIELTVDGRGLKPSEAIAYKSSMLGGVPNLAFAIGYTSSSWTLKIGLLSEHFCRLLAYMDERGLEVCTPLADPAMPTQPLLNLGSGYVRRSIDELPRQGAAFPWLSPGNYAADAKLFRRGKVNDENLQFTARY
jgi:cation diffusion facilitator CzcD-associated flavoprotein CzcO